MNERLKFRAWDNEDEKMDINFLNLTENFNVSVKKIAHSGRYDIMQFSGFQDSRNADIYEGDIVRIAGVGNVEVKFEAGSFMFGDKLYHEIIEDLENIVGNVYQNKGTVLVNVIKT